MRSWGWKLITVIKVDSPLSLLFLSAKIYSFICILSAFISIETWVRVTKYTNTCVFLVPITFPPLGFYFSKMVLLFYHCCSFPLLSHITESSCDFSYGTTATMLSLIYQWGFQSGNTIMNICIHYCKISSKTSLSLRWGFCP